MRAIRRQRYLRARPPRDPSSSCAPLDRRSLRGKQREAATAALTTLEKVADQAKELQKSLDKLSRQPSQRSAPQSPQAYQRSEELKTALERQAELGQQLDEASRDLQQSIEQAAERQAFDQELMRKLDSSRAGTAVQSQDVQRVDA